MGLPGSGAGLLVLGIFLPLAAPTASPPALGSMGQPMDTASGSSVKPTGLSHGQEAVSCPTALPAPSPVHTMGTAAPSPTPES